MSVNKEKKRLLAQLKALKTFPNNKLVKQLRKQIKKKLADFERKAKFASVTKVQNSIRNRKVHASKDTRSRAAKKYHQYIRLIHGINPEYSYMEIRQMLARRKEGKEVSIPDVIWQNPSP